MKAIRMSGVGGPEVLELAEIPVPAAGPNQILVRVHAAGVNPIDYKLRKTGALGFGAGKILGFDAAGTVEAVGAGVGEFRVGDRVFYSPDFSLPGAYAEYNVVQASLVAPMPTNLSFEEAAALPLAGMTGYDALFSRGGTGLGHTVLIAAANGGVGVARGADGESGGGVCVCDGVEPFSGICAEHSGGWTGGPSAGAGPFVELPDGELVGGDWQGMPGGAGRGV